MESALSPETQGGKVAELIRKFSRKGCSFSRIVWAYFKLFWDNKK